MAKFYTEKLGNAYIIGLGSVEIAKFWFTKEGESKSILSEEEAKGLAEDMCRFFEEKYDVDNLEEFGDDSDFTRFMIKMYDRIIDCCER